MDGDTSADATVNAIGGDDVSAWRRVATIAAMLHAPTMRAAAAIAVAIRRPLVERC